jgi:hypothetical protein
LHHRPGNFGKSTDAGVLVGGAPDEPERHGEQVANGDEDDVVTGEHRQGGHRGVHDMAAGNPRESSWHGMAGFPPADDLSGGGRRWQDRLPKCRRVGGGDLVHFFIDQILDRDGLPCRKAMTASNGENPGPVLDRRPDG